MSLSNSAAVILAAGAATRMGSPKQLLPFGGSTLLQHSIAEARAAGFERIVVVVGANADLVKNSIGHLSVATVDNPAWQDGMGSSVVAGMNFLLAGEAPDAVALLLADQPLVTAAHLRDMHALLEETSALVVAAEYSGSVGVPALFAPELFPALRSLPPAAGARHLLRGSARIVGFPLPEAALDIDTPADFAALTSPPART